MKKLTKISLSIFSIAIASIAISEFSSPAHGNGAGAPAGATGSPSDGVTCSQSGCHDSWSDQTISAASITSTIPVTGYVAGTVYTITGSITRAGHSQFGFEISPQNASGTILGTVAITSSQTKKCAGTTGYVTHTASGTSGTGSKSWSFNWTAPVTGSGDVTFYGAFNATNSDNGTSGDSIFTAQLTVSESTLGIANNSISKIELSVYPNPVTEYATVNYTLTENATVSAKLISLNGQVVKTFFEKEQQKAGAQERKLAIDASIAKGVYLISINVNNKQSFKKIIVE